MKNDQNRAFSVKNIYIYVNKIVKNTLRLAFVKKKIDGVGLVDNRPSPD